MPGRILNAYNRVVISGQVKVLVSSDGIENIVKPFIADCCVGVQQFDASDIKSLPLCFRYIESLARRQIMTHHLLPESIYLMTIHIISTKREVRRNGLPIREGAYYDFLG